LQKNAARVIIFLKNETFQKQGGNKMNILLACGGGMSSSILAESLTKEATKNGTTWEVDETSIDKVGDDLNEKDYSVVLLAPQVSFRKKIIAELAEQRGAKLILIPMTMYNPSKSKDLFDLVNREV
jgi:PTS system cellobiose-specific IIB component